MKRFIAAAVLCAMASFVQAQSIETFECRLNTASSRGFIGEALFFSIDVSQKRAAVFDGLIRFKHEAPIAAKLTVRRDDLYQLQWVVRDLGTNQQGRVDARFNMRFDPTDRGVQLNVNIGRSGGSPRASGRCQPVTGRSLL
ncbi:MAG: hypothetical protein AAFQ59_17835 [Pseudomonadota bacterium]